MLFDKLIERKVALFEQELLQKYYAEVENMYGKMRGWRHDYRHHIQAMKVHAAQGEMAEIQRYLDMLDDDLTNVETVVRTGNRAADAVLNSKLSLAGERQIRVKADVRIPMLLTTPELDLCTIIGNLLDNAMEACMELPPEKRLIRIYMEMKGNFLYFALTNTITFHNHIWLIFSIGTGTADCNQLYTIPSNLLLKPTYPDAQKLYINCDGGGSNGWRTRLWKYELALFAQESGLEIHVSHYPPGTSKWNKVEHRLFCYITKNWAGKPLIDINTIVNLISSTTTAKGLEVKCVVDRNTYQTGLKANDEMMSRIDIEAVGPNESWNYVIRGFK